MIARRVEIHPSPILNHPRPSPRRTSASLIGRLGHARISYCLGSLSFIRVTLLFAVWLMPRGASLHACVGLAVESLALGRASRCAAVIFGFIYYPAGASLCDAAERARTSSGEDDTIRFWFWAVQIMLCPPPSPDGTRCHLPTCGGAERPVCAQQRRQRDVCLSSASGASPRI